MTDKDLSKIYEEFENFLTTCNKFMRNLNAESSHGEGFETKEARDNFIKYSDEELKIINAEYEKFKTLLNSQL